MRKKVKTKMMVLGAVCMLCMTATACSTKDGENNTQEAEESSAPTQADEETENESTDPSSTDSNEDQNTSADSTATETDNTEETAESNNGRWHVVDPEIAKQIDADFEGNVKKIEGNAFFISETVTEITEDGFLMTMSAAEDVPDSDLLKVVYDDNTRFYTRTIFNGGESYEDSESKADSLEIEDSVSLKGSIKDDVFYADEVRISKLG